MKYYPEPYQERTTQAIIDTPKVALHIDMGLGKTVAVLTGLKHMIDNFDITSAIVVAPLRVATITWPDEIAKWDHLQGLDYVVVRGTQAKRAEILSEHHAIYLMNYEIIDWFVDWMLNNKSKCQFNTIVFDESSKLKSPSSVRFKLLKKVVASNLFERVIEMTGTPMPENYENLWSQYYLLDSGQRLGRYITHYRSRYFYPDFHDPRKLHLHRGAAEEIQSAIADITVTLLAEDHLNLPKVIVNDILVDLPPKARGIYSDIEDEMIANIEGTDVVAPSASSVSEKCRQIVAGWVYDEDKTPIKVHSAKFDALAELVDNLDGNLLVAYHYGFEETEITRRWPKAPVLGKNATDKQTRRYIDDWNAGKTPLMFMHPQSVGHGMNLQGGGHNICFLTPPWSGETYDQTIRRLQRKGQETQVTLHRIIVRKSVDQRVYAVLASKDRSQAAMMRALTDRK